MPKTQQPDFLDNPQITVEFFYTCSDEPDVHTSLSLYDVTIHSWEIHGSRDNNPLLGLRSIRFSIPADQYPKLLDFLPPLSSIDRFLPHCSPSLAKSLKKQANASSAADDAWEKLLQYDPEVGF